MAFSARLDTSRSGSVFAAYYADVERRIERAALIATDRAAREGLNDVRTAMQAAGLGRLGQGLGYGSDLREGRGVHRRSNGFSASGNIHIRSGSERTRGAIESYTNGAVITPKRSRYLWIATDDIPRVANRYRMTPALWQKNGFDTKIGPLHFVALPGGRAMLIIKEAGVSQSGKRRSARSLTKRGLPRKGQVRQENIIAFIGIPHTSRAARIDVPHVLRAAQQQMLNYFNETLGRN